jgi:hypothetical protein
VILFALAVLTAPIGVRAGSVFIKALTPDADPSRTVGISGITFDGSENPLVIDRTSWRMSRLNVSNGNVIQSTIPSPRPSGTTRSLVYDPPGNRYFTEQNQRLASINPATNSAATLSSSWPLFNFQGMAINPLDNRVWLATDNNGGELWEVNKTTGAVTLRKSLGVFHRSGGGISALAIGPTGDFFVAGSLNANVNDSIYKVDPVSGAVTFVTSLDFSSNMDFVTDFDYSPVSGRWYAVKEVRSTNPRQYHYLEITGLPLPEPCAAGVAALAALTLALERRPRRRRTMPTRASLPSA